MSTGPCGGDRCGPGAGPTEVKTSFAINDVPIQVTSPEVSLSADTASYSYDVAGDSAIDTSAGNTFQFDNPTSGRGGVRPGLIARLGMQATINRLGKAFVGTEAPISSANYGEGRIDVVSTDKAIEVKNVRNLYLTNENEIQLNKYVDAVGAQNLSYDIYSDYVHPDFIRALNNLDVDFHVYPYIPFIG